MTAYDIELAGCDNSTLLNNVDLSSDEHQCLVRIAALANEASSSTCEPTMEILLSPTMPPDELCIDCREPIGEASATREYSSWTHVDCRGAA